MGISIYYSGMLRNPSLITALIDEARDITEDVRKLSVHLHCLIDCYGYKRDDPI